MNVTQILDGLESSAATGHEADTIARVGFLEWVFAYPRATTQQDARRALAEPAAQNACSAAARAFVKHLEQATGPGIARNGRRGRSRRMS
ncbi:hypothetical protein [Roseovarius sp. SYSU LYC5161]|jgi:hypothetical protein|uniref:hypothetical protein n=1 Tax=Roseovarius halophilus (ex Wu et al. 2025) TaxID=3376060 RepID=UPI002870E4B3|nr:hypothetical protein [Roseovarius sp.]